MFTMLESFFFQIKKLRSLEFCSQDYIAYQEDIKTLKPEMITKWANQTIPVECDPFDEQRYLQKISILLLLFSIVIQFVYGEGLNFTFPFTF